MWSMQSLSKMMGQVKDCDYSAAYVARDLEISLEFFVITVPRLESFPFPCTVFACVESVLSLSQQRSFTIEL